MGEGHQQKKGSDKKEIYKAAIGRLQQDTVHSSYRAANRRALCCRVITRRVPPDGRSLVHAFELTENTLVCPPIRRVQAKHNDVIRNEISTVLSTRIARLATSPCGFPVVNERETVAPGFV